MDPRYRQLGMDPDLSNTRTDYVTRDFGKVKIYLGVSTKS